jgi:hypothetical protein
MADSWRITEWTSAKAEVIEAGKWPERRRSWARRASCGEHATLIANRQDDPVKILQQQISTSRIQRGQGAANAPPLVPLRARRLRFGVIADALGRTHKPAAEDGGGDETYFIQSASGEIVGRITWFGRRGK